MRGRQVCWSDSAIQKLAQSFVPAADEVWRLQHRPDRDCVFFRGFCEEGHYGGRTVPTNTRQGIYCCTPSGRFLASVNTSDPNRMAAMLREALANWKQLEKSERLLAEDPAKDTPTIRRRELQYPQDGLALRVYTRDGKRSSPARDWRAEAWNVDSLWYRKAEVRGMLPAKVEAGARTAWSKQAVERLVRLGLVDNVRGQTNVYAPRHVRVARIETLVERVEDGVAHVRFTGESRTSTTGTWPGEDGAHHPGEFDRGVRTTLFGEGAFDAASGRFLRFELAAAGSRWGQTRYNARRDDVDEAPIRFAIRLDEDDPLRRVAPAGLGSYGW